MAVEDNGYRQHAMIGPFVLPENAMVANQQQVVERALSYVDDARNSLLNNLGRDVLYPSETSQVFSIIGGRGTGKTSVLLTICDRLKNSYDDIAVANVLFPDRISSTLQLPLGPALIRLIEQALPSRGDDRGIDSDEEILHASWAARIPETFSVISRESLNIADWNSRMSQLVSETMEIATEFREWVKQSLDRSGNKLLVVPIDDADIAISRAEEVVDLLRTYLADVHILILLSCDVDALQRRILNKRLAELPPVPELNGDEKQPLSFLFGQSSSQFQASEAQAEAKYVEALVRKALPPAHRFKLSALPAQDILGAPFFLPGRLKANESLTGLFKKFDRSSRKVNLPRMAPLFRSHPLVFNGNLRALVNQYICVNEAAVNIDHNLNNLTTKQQKIEWEKSRSEAERLSYNTGDYLTKRSSGHLISEKLSVFPKISNEKQFIVSRAQMDMLAAVMKAGDFSEILQAYSHRLNRHLEDHETMHDFSAALLQSIEIVGTNYTKCIFKVAGRNMTKAEQVHMLGIVCDWILKAGMPLQTWLRKTNAYNFISESFRLIKVSQSLANRLSARDNRLLRSLDPPIKLLERSIDKKSSFYITAPVDMDRLFPFFIKDINSLGAYIEKAVNFDTFKLLDEAVTPYLETETNKGESDIYGPGIRIFAILSMQTSIHLEALETALLYKNDLYRRNEDSEFVYRGNNAVPWIVTESFGCLKLISRLIGNKDLDTVTKLLALSYIADLPTNMFWSTLQDSDIEKQRKDLLLVLIGFLDDLKEQGILKKRRRRSLRVGEIDLPRLRELGVGYYEILTKMPFDWKRRAEHIQNFLNGLKKASLLPGYDPFTEPPPLWVSRSKYYRPPKNLKAKKQGQQNK